MPTDVQGNHRYGVTVTSISVGSGEGRRSGEAVGACVCTPRNPIKHSNKSVRPRRNRRIGTPQYWINTPSFPFRAQHIRPNFTHRYYANAIRVGYSDPTISTQFKELTPAAGTTAMGHEEKPLPAMPNVCFIFKKQTFALRRAGQPGGADSDEVLSVFFSAAIFAYCLLASMPRAKM